ncbi:DegT/DnrJ/EryC1/StrS family aminotransferase [Paludibacterium denitrificans]
MAEILAIAREHKLKVVEDAAHAMPKPAIRVN